MRREAVVVTGIGLVTPAGVGREETWRGLCAGRPAAAHDPQLAGLPVTFSCRVPGFDAGELLGRSVAWRLDRCGQLALVAAREAWADAGLDAAAPAAERVAVVMGTAVGGAATYEEQHRRFLASGPGAVSASMLPGFLPNMVAGQISLALGARGLSQQVSTACASGATAVGIAAGLVRAGVCDVAVAGGAEAAVTPLLASAFARMGALSRRNHEPAAASRPFDADRDGFVLGEGAGVVVLERADTARLRGRSGYALLAGYGASCDAHHPVAPEPGGRGARAALLAALAEAGASAAEVDHVNAHGTSTLLNDAVESAVISGTLSGAPTVTAVKGVLGHLLGAAGGVEAAVTALTVSRGTVPPCVNLLRADGGSALRLVGEGPVRQRVSLAVSNSFGFGGHNAVLALRPCP